MRAGRAFGWFGGGLIGLGSALGAVTPVAGSEDLPDPIEVELAVWSADVADAMLLAEPELDENPFAVLVRFVDEVDGSAVDATLAPIVGRVVGAHTVEDGSTVHVVETRVGVDRALAHLRSSALVAAAEPDRVVEVDALTDDTHVNRLWGLDGSAGVDVEPAWADAAGAATVVVGVIDSGVDTDHPDLASVMWTNSGEIAGNGLDDDDNGYVDDIHGWDWVDDDNDPDDPNGHGTHVAGTIAAVQNNAEGVAGVATNVEIMALRFLNASGSGYTSDAIAALSYALDLGVTVTNNSWGGGSYSWTLSNLIESADDHLFIAAAGNSNLDIDVSPRWPAGYAHPNILTVASHNQGGARSSFSNHGLMSVDLSAPGGGIYSTKPGTYGWSSGTSMAAPHAAGVAALVLGVDPTLTPAEVVDVLERTTRWDDASIMATTRSGGHLDAGRAVAAAQPDAPAIAIAPPVGNTLVGDTIVVDAVAAADGGADLTGDVEWYVESVDGSFDGSLRATGAELEFSVSAETRVRVRAEVEDGVGGWNVAVWVFDVVSGPPGAPETVVVEGGDGTITVAWGAPARDGGAAISGYIATASPGTASCGTSSTSCTIEGVANGVVYTVEVVAFNGAGEGPASAPSGPVVPLGAPGAPSGVVAAAADESVTVSWTAPSDDGGSPVLGYEVVLAPSGRGCSTETTSCVIDGLPNDVEQGVIVWAVNSFGPGDIAEGGVVTPRRQLVRCDAVVASSSFVDLPTVSYAAADVECLRVLGVTYGTSPTTYSPAAYVTRAQMGSFLARMYREITGEPCAPSGSSFEDVAGDSFARPDIECLVALGITNGTSDTTYSPSRLVSREQMGSFLARMFRQITGEPCAPAGSSFDDVSSASFARADIECLVELGITTGTSPTTYSPSSFVNREQMAAFLGRLYRAIAT